jgi:MOSC domain-containing protein
MRVRELWRFPVKSLLGERLDQAVVAGEGLVGDRRFALYDAETGFGLTGRRVPDLLFASAAFRDDDGGVDITLPDGTVTSDDAALSDWLGRKVVLRSADEQVAREYEDVEDFEHEEASAWHPFSGATGAFHDMEIARVSLVSTATIGDWDLRRFRTNVVLDGEGEDALVGHRVEVGEVELDVRARIPRCVMTTRAQPGGVERDLTVLRTIARERDACLAVGAVVERGGVVRVGDELRAP